MRSRALRSVAAALAVGALVGLIVAGGGARLAMGLIALADDRQDFGSITGSGAFVGEITFDGTVAVLVTGMALGIFGAFVYVALRSWLPASGRYRNLVFVLIVLGFGLRDDRRQPGGLRVPQHGREHRVLRRCARALRASRAAADRPPRATNG